MELPKTLISSPVDQTFYLLFLGTPTPLNHAFWVALFIPVPNFFGIGFTSMKNENESPFLSQRLLSHAYTLWGWYTYVVPVTGSQFLRFPGICILNLHGMQRAHEPWNASCTTSHRVVATRRTFWCQPPLFILISQHFLPLTLSFCHILAFFVSFLHFRVWHDVKVVLYSYTTGLLFVHVMAELIRVTAALLLKLLFLV